MMHYIASTITFAILVLLQSTVFHFISIQGIIPDLSLIALVFLSNRNGKIVGETIGFAGGLFEDFLSLSPLGFHALTKTLLGFVFGFTHGVVFIGAVMMPMLMIGIATIVKAVLISFISSFFQTSLSGYSFFSLKTLVEIGYNVVLAPFIFAFLGLLKFLQPKER